MDRPTEQFKLLILGGIFSLILYLITLYTFRVVYPTLIVFFFSIIYIICFSIGIFLFLFFKKKWQIFLSFSITCNIALLTLVFAVFGPVFIDRSISYHIAFIVAEEDKVSAEEWTNLWTKDVFNKRFEDGVSGGMLVDNKDGIYSPTWKTKFFTKIMFLYRRILKYETRILKPQRESL